VKEIQYGHPPAIRELSPRLFDQRYLIVSTWGFVVPMIWELQCMLVARFSSLPTAPSK
jgi:hypothetical protein